MKILGIDPGLATVGFGIIQFHAASAHSPESSIESPINIPLTIAPITMIDFGVIKTPAGQEMGQRLTTIYEDLHAIIDQFQPDLAAAEKLFFYRMANTILVAQARGVLTLVLAQRGIPLVEFAPPQIKHTLTGHGNANKSEVQQAVARELDLEYIPKPDDAADALAVALTAWFKQEN